jgi:phage-related holin|tara:strand:- start:3137 stop:3541 length:405 start_codon:yes stop_codon:yes gene_type:complete
MKIITASSLGFGFILSYFMELTTTNNEQYLAVVAVVFLDGFFGMLAGVKREGFKTYKALKIIKSIFTWSLLLTVILMIEKGFMGTGWLSETVIAPFIVFQVISALKNASMAGLIKNELLNIILDKLDQHKGIRK